jgi:hypothetical protein
MRTLGKMPIHRPATQEQQHKEKKESAKKIHCQTSLEGAPLLRHGCGENRIHWLTRSSRQDRNTPEYRFITRKYK